VFQPASENGEKEFVKEILGQTAGPQKCAVTAQCCCLKHRWERRTRIFV